MPTSSADQFIQQKRKSLINRTFIYTEQLANQAYFEKFKTVREISLKKSLVWHSSELDL